MNARQGGRPEPQISASSFEEAFGEPLARALDLDTWLPAHLLGDLYARLEEQIAGAVADESTVRQQIRDVVFPKLETRPGAPAGAGLHRVPVDLVRKAHTCALFTGQVQACNGASRRHATLPLTVAQVGVCLVSYQGDQGTWGQRLFRRDLQLRGESPVDEALTVLGLRQRASAAPSRDMLAGLARRGIQSYAERAVLAGQADKPWRLGHGQPAPLELLTGSGSMDLLGSSLDVLEKLLCGHKRFIFVPSPVPNRYLDTLGNALNPLEYAIIDNVRSTWLPLIDSGYYDAPYAKRVQRFVDEVSEQVVVGVYRASTIAPAQVFYAHVEHAHVAALLAIADSTLQEHRGFPLLIDIADLVCNMSFGNDTLAAPVAVAYAEAGEPWRYARDRHSV